MKNLAVSVIIPMYNVERYIGECLESVLLQTLQDFEVIVVDDCSVDDSVQIVKSYIPKFNGRLQLVSMEKNTGGGGKPRNKGIEIARGEYIQFLDADDFMILNALETLYGAAKKYDADVVYSAAHYLMKNPDDVITLKDVECRKLFEAGLEDELALTVDEPEKNISKLLVDGNFHTPWTMFVRREFLLENKLFFPDIRSGEDFLWVIEVYCHAKRFLRHPVPLHFYRNYNEGSITQKKRSPQEQFSHWSSVFVTWAKHFSKLANEIDILKNNSAYCYQALKSEFEWCRYRSREGLTPLSNREVYELLQQKFANEEDLSLLAVPFFLTLTDSVRNARSAHLQIINDLRKEVKQLKSTVSVIVPMYNAEKYIAECLYNLLAQTFKRFEVIVVDDCSTDDSVKIVEEYAPSFNGQLTLTKTEIHSGNICTLRNVGLSLASGDYIYFVDAEDFLDNSALETLYRAAKENHADIVYTSRYRLISDHDESSLIRDKISKNLRKNGIKEKKTLTADAPNELLQDVLLNNQHCAAWTKFVRRKLLTENEITFPEVFGGEELWTLLICANSKRFLRLPTSLYFLRQRDSNSQTSISDFVTWFKAFNDIANKIEFLKGSPTLCCRAAKNYFDSLALNSQELCKTLLNESDDDFTKAFCRLIAPKQPVAPPDTEDTPTTPEVKADDIKVEYVLPSSTYPVSVVVTLYNCRKYIGECLDSLLAQTFQDFEVIVVDDCSTNDSVKIVEGYVPKFVGRLTLTKTHSNSGGGSMSRNKGMFFAKGEYIFFMNADDTLTETGLEEMYNAAKNFDADITYCEKYFVSSNGNVREVNSDSQKSTFETNDLAERIDKALKQNYSLSSQLSLVSRKLLIENNINFSSGVSDIGWALMLLLSSKKFLQIPNACYIKRIHDTKSDNVNKLMSQMICGLKEIEDFMSSIAFFKANPSYRYDLLNLFIRTELEHVLKQCDGLSTFNIYDSFREQFGEHATLISCLCNTIISQQREIEQLKSKE